ncbi:MAG: C4-dicarboxylate transporter [Deltaproteobacteria bacterium]|jgi:TRAP transporter 4TM/12TM fusion protein|nr:C4-dicarboxylate transporter [Deltaproteobacteria bacterium]
MTWREFWSDRPAYQRIAAVISAVLAVFHIHTALFGALDPLMQRSIHLGLCLILVFLVHGSRTSGRTRIPGKVDLLLMSAAVLVLAYVFIRYDWITLGRFALVTPTEWYEDILGILIIIVVLEAGRRVVNPALVYVAIGFLLYPLAAPYLPGMLHAIPVGWQAVVEFNYLTYGGIFGIPLGASATDIALFVFFGAILMKSGGSALISNIAMNLAGRYVGGPAKVAVVASALMGMISGSATANVATVGTMTIPMMRKAGYHPNFAGAVEAMASCGGQIMPPVLGAAAFVMSAFTGIPYGTICFYAAFPAILYFFSLFCTVDLEARRLRLRGLLPESTAMQVLSQYGHMILPIFILLYFLFAGYTPRLAGALGIISALVISQCRQHTRMNIPTILSAFESGAKGMLIVCVSTAIAGMLVASLDLTGLSQRFGSAFMSLTGGNVLLGLILGMIIAFLLGLGLPTTPAYIIQVTTVIPALIKLGLPVHVAHLFAFYYACLALITPPDAGAAYVAASIAGGDGWRTGWLATRMALVAFIVPFMFAYDQSLLWIGGVWQILLSSAIAFLGVWALAVTCEGYFLRELRLLERIAMAVVTILLLIPLRYLNLVGAVALGLFMASQILARRRVQAAAGGNEFA